MDQYQHVLIKTDTHSSLYYRQNYRKFSVCHYSLYYYYVLVVYDSVTSCCALLTNSKPRETSQSGEEESARADSRNHYPYQEPLLNGGLDSGDTSTQPSVDTDEPSRFAEDGCSRRHRLRNDVENVRHTMASGTGRTKGKNSKMIERISELDMTPQLNMALRREVLHCATDGIKTSIVMKTKLPDPADFFDEDDDDFEEDEDRQGYYSVGGQEAAAAATRELAESRRAQSQSNGGSLSANSYSGSEVTSASVTSAAISAVNDAIEDPNRATPTKKLQYENDYSQSIGKAAETPDKTKKRKKRRDRPSSRSRLNSSASWVVSASMCVCQY